MSDDPKAEVTRILNGPDQSARLRAAELLPIVYAQLRALAQQHMNGERSEHTLQATALVHEAYLRLIDDKATHWANRAHFYAAAAEAMRRILIDHARAKNAVKRGPGRRLSLHLGGLDLADEKSFADAVILDDAISRLEREDARAANVVRLRFFAGLSIDETAAVVGVSSPTVKRDWEFARAWLADALQDEEK